ncbi:hypothetical protein SDC9_195610 [bioreactor metagenome]|uniref:Chromosome partition protein Smc n=1 Tax=bioreactor metagenome TaxID=1076179 RepID=A0A645IAR8_9ZZZZ
MELIAAKVGGIETEVNGLRGDVGGLKEDVGGLKEDVGGLSTRMEAVERTTQRTELMIENEIKPKIEALFDGYFQNSDKLDRIEKEVSRQEEVILRKVK